MFLHHSSIYIIFPYTQLQKLIAKIYVHFIRIENLSRNNNAINNTLLIWNWWEVVGKA